MGSHVRVEVRQACVSQHEGSAFESHVGRGWSGPSDIRLDKKSAKKESDQKVGFFFGDAL